MRSTKQSRVEIPLLWERPDTAGRVLGGLDYRTLLSRSLIEDDATHISSTQNILLMLNSIDMTDDEAHALAARRLHRGFASVGLRAMLSTSNLGSALDVLSRYFTACSSAFRLEVSRQDDVAQVAFRAEGRGGRRAVLLEEIWFNALYAFMCWFVGRRLPVLSATVARVERPNVHRVHWAAQASLFRGDLSSVRIPLACLEWRRRANDVEEPVWEALRFWIDEDAPPAARREGGLNPVLGAAEAPARVAAREAFDSRAISDRQLSRRLKREHGANFRTLRGEALVDIARDLLRSTDDPIDAIAAQLGYAEERSFRRFMQNQTGLTPAQIRRGTAVTPEPGEQETRARIHALTRKMEI